MVFETIATMIATKGLETIATESVKALIETHVKPFLQKEAEWNAKLYEVEDCIKEYLEITYKKAMIMNTIVFRGIEKTLCDLYLPLTLEGAKNGDNRESICVDEKCLNDIMNWDKILIVDTAGMGKSTITKFLIVKYIDANERIPILIELRKVKKDQEIIDYIVEQFKLLGKNIEKEDMISMLRRGDFVIFLDGYDEVANELKSDVMDEIQDFFLKAGNNQYIVTSREETDLMALGDFKRFSIKPLSIDEAFELISRYDQNGELSKKLIQRIKQDKQLEVLEEFLTNAMLTSLLYKTFQYKEEIAYKKLDFYSQVYEALFNDHDKTKGGAYVHEKLCLLDSTDFERLLRRIAFYSLKENKLEYTSKADFLEIIQKSIKNMYWLDVKADYVLHDLTHAVPFFQKDGVSYKWVHKSFMEYFSAGYVCYESNAAEKLIEKMTQSDNFKYYTNVLDFCSEMKPEIFRKKVVYPFLCEYIDHCEKAYLQYEEYDFNYIEALRTTSFVSRLKMHVYNDFDECEKAFRKRGKEEELFSPKDIGRVSFVTHWANERMLTALSVRKTMEIYNFLLLKNVDIFNPEFLRKGIDESLDYTHAMNRKYIITDEREQWYNSQDNYKRFSTIWINMLRNYKRIRPKSLSYDKCKKLKERIQIEIRTQNQIDSDLDLN